MKHHQGGEITRRQFVGYGATEIQARNSATFRAEAEDYTDPVGGWVEYRPDLNEYRYEATYRYRPFIRRPDENTPPHWWFDIWRVLEDRLRRIFRR